jgi:hypothetical protein
MMTSDLKQKYGYEEVNKTDAKLLELASNKACVSAT